MIQQLHSWAYIQMKLEFKKLHASSMFRAALVAIANTQKQLKCPVTDE